MSVQYENAKEVYARLNIDTEEALKKLQEFRISIHCWQGDDVSGFEPDDHELSGGIQATGNYPGKARNADELRQDLGFAMSFIGGTHKVNLHAVYAETKGRIIPRNELLPEHFESWLSWAKEKGLGLDFNPTCFSHPLASDGLTLSHPNPEIRRFWIEHAKACRHIAEYFGRELNDTSLCNLWIPDGYKDIPSDRLGPRMRLKEALDEIYSEQLDRRFILDSVESKVFGIGAESFTVGSSEFYLNYAMKNNIIPLMDTGHYHPTETVSDKISALLPFYDQLALHVSRPVRWDSDHVVLFDDELKELAKEIVRNHAEKKIIVGLDYFDASINRIAAWVLGVRNMQKAYLYALLQPHEQLKRAQDEMDYTERLVLMEELKTYPLDAVWNEFCQRSQIPEREDWLKEVRRYEQDVLSKRKDTL